MTLNLWHSLFDFLLTTAGNVAVKFCNIKSQLNIPVVSWSEFLASVPEVPAVPGLLSSSGSGRGSLSLMRLNEELLERKVTALAQKTEINGHGEPLC
jgi:hypothetical protein